MSNSRREIQQMHRDVDALAKKSVATGETAFEVFTLAHPDEYPMKIRLRQLQVGEKRRFGDLWLDPFGSRLRPLIVPWWTLYGNVTEKHVPHFRIIP